MTILGRMFVRIVSYATYIFLFALVLALLFSDYRPLEVLGILLLLFLGDRMIHAAEGDRPLSELPQTGAVNAARYMSPRALLLIERIYDRSIVTESNVFLEACLRLLAQKEIEEGMRRLDVPPAEFKQKLEGFLKESRNKPDALDALAGVQALVLMGFDRAVANGHRFVYPSDLFAALPLIKDELVDRLFKAFMIDAGDLDLAMVFSGAKTDLVKQSSKSLTGVVPGIERGMRHRVMNRAWTSRPTPTLDRFSADFTDMARAGSVGFLVGHRGEYARLIETLARPIHPNAILIGEAGIGKEALIAHLAFELTTDRVPSPIFDKRLVALDVARLVAGAAQAELQERVKRVAEEIVAAGNIILYIPDIHNLMKTSGEGFLSAADALSPVIEGDAFPVVGTTYPREYKQLVEPRSDFTGIFEAIRVEELTENEAQRLLVYESLFLEAKTKIVISFGAVKTSVKLAKKYFSDTRLPGSAEALLKSALSLAAGRGDKFLGPDTVIAAAEEKTNIPIREATGEEAEALLHLEETIHSRLVDQEEAVAAVANALREYRSGIAARKGPIASFLFVGPTGVGKTELAKTLAAFQFGSEEAMIRFDMTEYQDKQSFVRFIGSADGSVAGALTDAVREKPYSLVLLDEFEKAFPDILNLFLQVLDDGRLTDHLGRTVNFSNAIVIATSNAHSDIINEAIRKGETMEAVGEYVKRRLTDAFRPELLNRFSRIVIFRDLSIEQVAQIASRELRGFSQHLSQQGITISFDPEVIKLIAKLGYDPSFGARPLRRVINDRIKAPLAQKILRKEIPKGGEVKVGAAGEEIMFTVEEV